MFDHDDWTDSRDFYCQAAVKYNITSWLQAERKSIICVKRWVLQKAGFGFFIQQDAHSFWFHGATWPAGVGLDYNFYIAG